MKTPLRCGMEYPRYSRRKRVDEPGSPVRKGGVVHVTGPRNAEAHGRSYRLFMPHWIDAGRGARLRLPTAQAAGPLR